MHPDRNTGNAAVDTDARDQRSPENVEDRLADLLARVRDDARTRPNEYARDTEVPEGGE